MFGKLIFTKSLLGFGPKVIFSVLGSLLISSSVSVVASSVLASKLSSLLAMVGRLAFEYYIAARLYFGGDQNTVDGRLFAGICIFDVYTRLAV